MSNDIATLGLAIDSRQAVTAKTALEGFATAAKPAAQAATALESAAAKANATLPKMAAATDKAGQASELAGKRHGAAAGSLANLSFQINDIASGVAMGQSPFQILAQQGGQVYQVYQLNNQVFRQAKDAILGFLTPMRLLGIAGAAVAVAGYAISAAWETSTKQLDDTARAAGTTIQTMRGLQQLASFKGIDADEFFKAFDRFSQNVYEARAGMGGMAEVFRANNIAAGDFDQSLERAADLIKRARDDQQRLSLLRQMGLPATMEWVRLLSGGADGIRKAREQLGFVNADEQKLIDQAREFDEAWSRAWLNFKSYAVQAVIGVKAALHEMHELASDVANDPFQSGLGIPPSAVAGAPGNPGAKVTVFGGGARNVPTPRSRPAGAAAVDKDFLQRGNSLIMQRVGLLGQLATTDEMVRAKEAELSNAFLSTGVGIGNRKQALLDLVRLQSELSKASEAGQFGIFNPGQQAEIQRLQLNTLIADGTIKNAQDYASAVAVITKNIRDASDAAAIARSPLEQMTRYSLDATNSTKQLDQFGASSMSNLENGLVSFASGTKKAKDAFKDMANSIISDMLRMVIRSQITGPLSGALSGLFTSAFGGGPTNVVGGAGSMPVPTFRARGGPVSKGRPYVVGENEAELFVPDTNGTIIPSLNGSRGTGSGSGTPIVNNFIVENHASANVQKSQQKNSSGGTDYKVVILQAVNEGMAAGKMDASLRGRTGTRPPKVI